MSCTIPENFPLLPFEPVPRGETLAHWRNEIAALWSSSREEWCDEPVIDLSAIEASIALLVAANGEANTASNVGTLGTGVFKQKSGLDLEFYKLNSFDNKMAIALVGTDRIDFTINSNNVVNAFTGTLLVSQGGTGAVTLTGILQGNGVSAVTGINGTANYLPKWSVAAPYLSATSLVYDNGTYVGVGVGAAPLTALHVASSTAGGVTGSNIQLRLSDSINTAKCLLIGWDTVNAAGYIQATEVGISANLLQLNPSGGNVKVGSGFIIPLTGYLYGNGAGIVSASATIPFSSITGTVGITQGGTGQITAVLGFNALSPLTTRGDLLTRDATNNIRLAIGTVGKYLRTDGTDPGWSALLTSDLSGTITVAQGGTGATTLTGMLQGNGAGAVTAITGTTDVLPKWAATAPYLVDSLLRSGTNLVEQYNSTNAQSWSLYGTRTDASNYERLTIKHTGGGTDGITFTSEALGSGVARDFIFSGARVGIGISLPVSKLHVVTVATGITGNTWGTIIDNDVTLTANAPTTVGIAVSVRNRGAVNQTDVLKGVVGVEAGAFNYNTAITTNVSGFRFDIRNLGVGTVTNLMGAWVSAIQNSGGGVVTNVYGVRIEAQTVGANNYGVWSNLATAANRFNIYALGTAPNYFAGNVGIGTNAFGTSMAGGFAMKNGTAPSADVADVFQMYSADQAAGNAAPHFRTELGDIIKLYKVATYTPTNVTTDRSFDANLTTIDELADVLGTLIADIKLTGLLG